MKEHVYTHDTRFGIVFFILSLIGVGDTTYLLVKHFQGAQDVCLFTQGCDKVLESSYATMLGMPMALWGFIFYFLVFITAVFFLAHRSLRVLYALAGMTVVGFVFSLVLVYLQAFVIGSFCEFCMLSATTSTLLFITAVYVMVHKHKRGLHNILWWR